MKKALERIFFASFPPTELRRLWSVLGLSLRWREKERVTSFSGKKRGQWKSSSALIMDWCLTSDADLRSDIISSHISSDFFPDINRNHTLVGNKKRGETKTNSLSTQEHKLEQNKQACLALFLGKIILDANGRHGNPTQTHSSIIGVSQVGSSGSKDFSKTDSTTVSSSYVRTRV